VYRNRTSWLELPSPSAAQRSTTSSDGMWFLTLQDRQGAPRLCVISPTHCRFPAPSNDYRVYTADGPYAETKEQLGGILVLAATDLNHAVQLRSKYPGVKAGAFEMRPAEA